MFSWKILQVVENVSDNKPLIQNKFNKSASIKEYNRFHRFVQYFKRYLYFKSKIRECL